MYYTKETLKTLKVFLIGTGMILTVVGIKYRPAYEVTLSGEKLGYTESKEIIENKLNKYMSDTNGNIAFREIYSLPKYELKLINREENTEEEKIMLAIENSTLTTYKLYAVTLDGEQKAIVDSTEEAQSVIDEMKNGLNEAIDLKLGIAEIYTTEYNISSREEAANTLNEIKAVRVAAYEQEKANKVKADQAAAAASRAKSIASTTQVAATGNISGLQLSIPVNGSVSSRFGSRSSSRSSIHTGLDIASSLGTGIRSIASGTVTYAGFRGTYGNLVIINHGNGVESYYAHCNALYVSVGQNVDSSTTIGAVGSTGNSTGPHLHLEIRVNGSPVNPQNYLY